MYIDGDRLVVSLHSDLLEVQELAAFIKDRLEFIDGIDLEEEHPDEFGSSALFQLLAALKATKPELHIPLFESKGFAMDKMGTFYWGAAWTKND